MSDKQKSVVPPHAANVPTDKRSKQGAYDVPNRDTIGDGEKSAGSSKHQSHSGRPHPPKQKLGGDEFDHANQGSTSTQNRGE